MMQFFLYGHHNTTSVTKTTETYFKDCKIREYSNIVQIQCHQISKKKTIRINFATCIVW